MRLLRRLFHTLSIAVLAAGAMIGTAAPAAAETPVPEFPYMVNYKLWHWNISGYKMSRGSTTNGLIGVAASSIQNRSADFASFSEMCYGQYTALKNALRDANWPVDETNFSRWTPSISGDDHYCNGQDFGNAIFAKKPLGNASRWTLPSDGTDEPRTLTCVNTEDNVYLHYCTTHITTETPNNANQLRYVLDRLEAYHTSGHAALIGGDFNAQPHYGRLNGWYSSSLNTANNGSNTGQYRELDDNDSGNCPGYGEFTALHPPAPNNAPPCSATQPLAKVDLMFVRESRLLREFGGGYSGDSLDIAKSCSGIAATDDYPAKSCSDHRIIIGSVTLFAGKDGTVSAF
ncbi:endonuclease/exonuclease/phosphatase family protein [Actinoplanes siamensis]|uniref:Endonuclease/exonuclease/phosphatase domain-containing protein n=1 Tax=Actinoplanes siamensis TaxID=1223317 RepID=A0A919N630_9ACTN|nr:endonuclease/exonuclease/phosphatase family protein [Actinoplanes siamensis]GIF05128.1 hypothetical protein Asi03nite_26660 [Actinoplanes siamensis]